MFAAAEASQQHELNIELSANCELVQTQSFGSPSPNASPGSNEMRNLIPADEADARGTQVKLSFHDDDHTSMQSMGLRSRHINSSSTDVTAGSSLATPAVVSLYSHYINGNARGLLSDPLKRVSKE